MALGTGFITKVVARLLAGDAIDELLEKKLEDLGENFLRRQLSGPLGILSKFDEDSFEQQRDAWLNKVTKLPIPKLPHLPHQALLNKLFTVIGKTADIRKRRHSGRGAKWQKTAWARSRNDWLENQWKHDWRSQPRNPVTGQWMPGRLDYVDRSMMKKGRQAGRITKRRRKLRRAARMRGKNAARQLFGKYNRRDY
jgi:hypothetical protein